jgi:hypothetical protein
MLVVAVPESLSVQIIAPSHGNRQLKMFGVRLASCLT